MQDPKIITIQSKEQLISLIPNEGLILFGLVSKRGWLTYLRDAVEHDSEEQVGAVGLLSSLRLILEEWELALDEVPNRHLVDVIYEYEGVECEDEVLHAVDGRQEHFLQVLGGLGRFRHNHVDRVVVELEGEAESSQAQNEHDNVLYCFYPDQLHHLFNEILL